MSKNEIDIEKYKQIIQGSYKELRKKERTNSTKQATVTEIIKLIEKVLKNEDK